MPTALESEIRARLERFAANLAAAIRESALDAAGAAFGATRGRGRTARGVKPAPTRSRKGQKRDPQALAALTEKLGAYIAKNTGLRIEQIGKALGVATKELALPVKKLIAGKVVSTKGQKRATTYHAGGGKRSAKADKTKAPAKRKPKATAKAGAKRAAPKRAAVKRPAVKRAAPKRATAKRAAPKPAASKRAAPQRAASKPPKKPAATRKSTKPAAPPAPPAPAVEPAPVAE